MLETLGDVIFSNVLNSLDNELLDLDMLCVQKGHLSLSFARPLQSVTKTLSIV